MLTDAANIIFCSVHMSIFKDQIKIVKYKIPRDPTYQPHHVQYSNGFKFQICSTSTVMMCIN